MVEQTPEFLQTGSYTAQDLRQLVTDFLKNSAGTSFGSIEGGVIGSNDLKVTPNSLLTVNVAAGTAYVRGTSVSMQGGYRCWNDATVTKQHATADATNPRNDLIVARVYDNAHDSSGQNKWAIEIVQGTPAASPVDPATPASSHRLARVRVNAGATTITSGNITDLRAFLGLGASGTLGTGFMEFALAGEYGKKILYGTTDIAVTTSVSSATGSVTFSSAFGATPRVYASPQWNHPSTALIHVYSQATTGFSCRVLNPQGANFGYSDNITVQWMAIGT